MKRLEIFLLALIFSLLFFTSSCREGIKFYDDEKAMVTDAKTKINTIITKEFKVIFDGAENYSLIDCREPNEFIESHIPGAINIPRGLLEFKIGNLVPRRYKVIIYSQNGDRSALAAANLIKLKYSYVNSIDGGLQEWLKEYPELVEEGAGEADEAAPAPKEESGGCGG